MSTNIAGAWGDAEGLRRVKSVTPENVLQLKKLQESCVSSTSSSSNSHRRFRKRNPPIRRPQSQSQSLFFQLPGEVRNIIYRDFVTFQAPIHIWKSGNRVYSWECSSRLPARQIGEGYDGSRCCEPLGDAVNEDEPGTRRRRSRVLGFLTSCRRIYFEATALLYAHNTLHIHHAAILPRLLPNPSPDGQSPLLTMRTLHLSFSPLHRTLRLFDNATLSSWRSTCAILHHMHHLTHLRITILDRDTRWWPPRDTRLSDPALLLYPLCGIAERVPDFVVEMAPALVVWLQGYERVLAPVGLGGGREAWGFLGVPVVVLESPDVETDTEFVGVDDGDGDMHAESDEDGEDGGG
ncbi:hypothetical protein BJX64DRAFT_284020 [Aspergillus heterothallicus]